ncbi:MAG TPA: LysM peptidoglycan-binding domain-containing M23 family metallopeptidase [Deinococcales bacterium]|nr:LysM peptidoglycan-binding domain-containing M23 family metallopeptidase [Deinococcales bacterium]
MTVTVEPKTTLWRLAQMHGTTVERIQALNRLNSDAIQAGQTLVVEHGSTAPAARGATPTPTPPALPAAPAPAPGDGLVWPVQGVITQGYSPGVHDGIDIGAPTGTPIHAAASGTVTFAAWDSTGYGNRVVVRGLDGRRYSYAHASALTVHAGQTVAQGQTIALVGSTGNSTGPHLDFRIYAASGPSANPVAALPANPRVQLAGYRPAR